MAPNELVVVTASVVHRQQSQSFKKAKCVHKGGKEDYIFTGEPFQNDYHVTSCVDMCYARIHYQICDCANFIGWNLTRTDCLHKRQNRDCLMDTKRHNLTELMDQIIECSSNCHQRCDQKLLETQVLHKQHKWTDYQVKTSLELISQTTGSSSAKAKQLSQIFTSRDSHDIPKRQEIAKHMSHVFIRLGDEPVKVVKIIPLVTFSTFISNVGGILGMCLGLSAISLFEVFEMLLQRTLASPKPNQEVLQMDQNEKNVKVSKDQMNDETDQNSF